jgi:surface polysaccharide O-acyltransferase-like enzyme
MGIAALGVAYLVPGSSDRITEMLSPLAYGIYLIHPVFVLLLHRRIDSWPALASSVVVLSVVACLVLHRTRLKAVM